MMSGAAQAEALLDIIAGGALDDDYYAPHERRAGGGGMRWITALVTAAFGLAIALAAIESATDAPAREQERRALVNDIADRRVQVAEQRRLIDGLNAQIRTLRAGATGAGTVSEAVRIRSGADAVTGRGIEFTVRSGTSSRSAALITDTDLQLLVNGLWYAGAEAIAVNGQRLGSLTSIRTAGQAVTVNYRALTEPYTISAIGDPSSLEQRWIGGPSGRYWQQRGAAGVTYAIVKPDAELVLPAVPGTRLAVRDARVIREGRTR